MSTVPSLAAWHLIDPSKRKLIQVPTNPCREKFSQRACKLPSSFPNKFPPSMSSYPKSSSENLQCAFECLQKCRGGCWMDRKKTGYPPICGSPCFGNHLHLPKVTSHQTWIAEPFAKCLPKHTQRKVILQRSTLERSAETLSHDALT